MSSNNRIILITGATSGFGKAIAYRFAAQGNSLILTGRRKHLLQEMAKELESKHHCKVLTLCFDVRILQEVETAVNSLPAEWKQIEVLVNNAGLAAGLDPIHKGKIEDWERMIDTNIKGLLYMTRAIVPFMVANGHGHIINIGSLAGRDVYPAGNVYCGSKAAVDSITRGMRMDLLEHHIKVTLIAPGAAETEFSLVRFDGDATRAAGFYKGYQPLKAEDVADLIFYAANLPPHVNLNDVVITSTAQASTVHFHKRP